MSGLRTRRGGQRVEALVELVGEPEPGAVDDILAHAKRHLADYKVPERLILVAQIPRTTLGKVNRASVLARFQRLGDL
jgi:acyl-CoA synthetase (AMP-forming)/AMP-acid ligase II